MKLTKGQDKQVVNMQCSNTTRQHKGASRLMARKYDNEKIFLIKLK